MREYTASTYGDRIAGVYDSFYGSVDVELRMDVLEKLAAGGRALDLGIGTGSFALPLAARGVEVHGIDVSEAMVEELRTKSGGAEIPVTIGDFADVAVEGTFSLVYVLNNTFFMLTEQEEQVQVLRERGGAPGCVGGLPGGCVCSGCHEVRSRAGGAGAVAGFGDGPAGRVDA